MKKKHKPISNAFLGRAYMHAVSEKVAKTQIGFTNPKSFKEAQLGNENFLPRLRALAEYIIKNHK